MNILCRFLAAVLAALLLGPSAKAVPGSMTLTEESLPPVSEALQKAGLAHVDTFEQWVLDFRTDSENDLGSADFSDADCRMTVMLLTGDLLRCDSPAPEYDGTYLMFDLDAIENRDAYGILRDKKALFTTLFGEIPITAESYADAFSSHWKAHGIHFDSETASIISIVFETFEEDAVFVGHTGVLVDCRGDSGAPGDYLFVEKIAFGDPFLATWLDSPEELLDVFSQRPDYFAGENGPAPLVFRNGECLGPLPS